jgi:FtsZ-binding cell division protein ZapB
MGSVSAGANVPGIGISFGKTYTDENCIMLKNSREMWNYGMKAASLALMCQDPANFKAIHDSYTPGGYLCPGDTPPGSTMTPEELKKKEQAFQQEQKDAQEKQAKLQAAAQAASAAAAQASAAAKQAAEAAQAASAQAATAAGAAPETTASKSNSSGSIFGSTNN